MPDLVICAAREGDWEGFHLFLIDLDTPLDSLERAQQRFDNKITSSLYGVFVVELEGQIVGSTRSAW